MSAAVSFAVRGLLLFALVSFAACRQRGSAPAQTPPEVPAAEVETASVPFQPVFTAEAIPSEVEARMRGKSYPEGASIALSDLRYLRLSYYDFSGTPRTGEMVCNAAIAQDLLEIFEALFEAKYPIRSIRLVDDFGGSDDASMLADNSSCFNYRVVAGTRTLSRHALGMAVDINPFENPYIRPNGEVLPPEAKEFVDRTRDFPHKIDREDLCYRLFREHGFTWGGAWTRSKDYQHFQK